jgi:4-amino-4-deoxy-L-arabinose transferase-like glycosyltransferase
VRVTTRPPASSSPADLDLRRALVGAAAILAFAVAIGLWRLDFGLDLGIAFTDERLVFGRYLAGFVPLSLDSFDRPPGQGAFAYPTLLGYLIGFAAWVCHRLGLIASPRVDVFQAFFVARIVVAAFAVANVAVIGLLARLVDSRRAGLCAAALMAVVPVCVLQAHYVSTDPAQCFFMTLALALSYLLLRDGGGWLAFLAGSSVGLAFAAKYTGILAAVPVAWAVLERALAGRQRDVRTLLALGTVALLGCLAGAVVACPLCFVRTRDVLATLTFYSGLTAYENLLFWRTHLMPDLGWYARPVLYQLVAGLPFSLGLPTFLAALAGIVGAVRRRDAADRLLLVTIGVYFLFAVLSVSLLPRYLIPLLPPLVLLAARSLARVRGRALRLVLFWAVWLSSALVTVTQVARLSYDQQMAVADWLRRAVAESSAAPSAGDEGAPTIAVPAEMWSYVGLVRPFQLAGITPVLVPAGRWLDGHPDVLVLPDLVAEWIRTRPQGKPFRDDLDALESGRGGYVPAARWRSRYFAQDVYTALDPVFVADYPQGEIGFTVYARAVPTEGRNRSP